MGYLFPSLVIILALAIFWIIKRALRNYNEVGGSSGGIKSFLSACCGRSR